MHNNHWHLRRQIDKNGISLDEIFDFNSVLLYCSISVHHIDYTAALLPKIVQRWNKAQELMDEDATEDLWMIEEPGEMRTQQQQQQQPQQLTYGGQEVPSHGDGIVHADMPSWFISPQNHRQNMNIGTRNEPNTQNGCRSFMFEHDPQNKQIAPLYCQSR